MSKAGRCEAHLWIGRILRKNANTFPGKWGVGKCPPMKSLEMSTPDFSSSAAMAIVSAPPAQ